MKMVNVDKIEMAIASYFENEILNKTMDVTSPVRFGISIMAAPYIRSQRLKMEKYLEDETMQAMGIVDKDKNIDVEWLRDEAKRKMPEQGIVVSKKILGEEHNLTFTKEDVDTLYQYITKQE